MNAGPPVTRGMQAGLLAGGLVAAYFGLGDLLRLAPLSTPAALSRLYVGGLVSVDVPIVSQLVGITMFGARLLVFTGLHLAVFAMLGGAAVVLFAIFRWPLNMGTGALYGLTVFSLVFYGGMAIAGREVLEGMPGLREVALANLLGGAVMGGFVRRFRRGGPKD